VVAEGPILIGGAARNGKSMLAGMIGRASAAYWGVPFELLLNVQPSDAFTLSQSARSRTLRDYVLRRRAISSDRTQTSGPSDFIEANVQDFVIARAAECGGVVPGIAALLDEIARKQNARTWVGADYHAECDFEFLRRKIPGLRLIIVVRDPVEAIAASLYWKTFPDRAAGAQRETAMRVALWKMSVAISLRLAKRYPSEVMVLNSNQVWAGQQNAGGRLAAFIGCMPAKIQGIFDKEPWFTRNSVNEFLGPDGTRRLLLSHNEVAAIEKATTSLLAAFGGATPALPPVLRLAARFPRLARHLIMLRYRPRQRLMRNVSALRRAARLATTF